jgi:hypothetical protein
MNPDSANSKGTETGCKGIPCPCGDEEAMDVLWDELGSGGISLAFSSGLNP